MGGGLTRSPFSLLVFPSLLPDPFPWQSPSLRRGEGEVLTAAEHEPGAEPPEVPKPVGYPHELLVLGVEPLDRSVAYPPPIGLEAEGIDDVPPPIRDRLHEGRHLGYVGHRGIRPQLVEPFDRGLRGPRLGVEQFVGKVVVVGKRKVAADPPYDSNRT